MAIVNYYTDVDKQSVFFESRQRLNVLENILNSIQNESELIVLTGESGTGKTLFLDKILQSLESNIASFRVPEHDGSYEGVITALFLKVNFTEGEDEQVLALESKVRVVVDYLEAQYAANRHVLISIDNAQNLNVQALSQILNLAKPQDNQHLLFKLLLVGLPDLSKLVLDAEIVDLSAKKPDYHRLDPLGIEEVKAFIRMRLERYKFKEKDLFAPHVLALILNLSNGLLKLLDSLFDSVILFSDSTNKITQAGFNEAVDFFSLLVRPSMLKAEQQAPKSLFYKPNQHSTDSSLVSNLKDKVTHIFPTNKADEESVNSLEDLQIGDDTFTSYENVVPLVNLNVSQKPVESVTISISDVPQETIVKAEENLAETTLVQESSILRSSQIDEEINNPLAEHQQVETTSIEQEEVAIVSPNIAESAEAPVEEMTLTGMVIPDFDEPDVVQLSTEVGYTTSKLQNQAEAELPPAVFKPLSNQEIMMSRSENLSSALKSLKELSPDIDAAALISDDGLIIVSVLPQDLDETRVGAMSATLLSLGTRTATTLKRGKLEEVIVKGEYGYAALMNAGRGTMLLAVTNENAKPGLVFFDMREAIEKINKIL